MSSEKVHTLIINKKVTTCYGPSKADMEDAHKRQVKDIATQLRTELVNYLPIWPQLGQMTDDELYEVKIDGIQRMKEKIVSSKRLVVFAYEAWSIKNGKPINLDISKALNEK